MKIAQHPTALRTQKLLIDAGVNTQVVEFDQPTRTSAEAAHAIGCQVGEIAKSVVFKSKISGQAVIVVASGKNRISENKITDLLGEQIERANADFVREKTGYVIGGVAPLGYANAVKLILDRDLQAYKTIWAAAGTPFSVFCLTPQQLIQLTGAQWEDVKSE